MVALAMRRTFGLGSLLRNFRSKIKTSPLELPHLETIVPGQLPIKLSAYYPDFIQYYPTCELQTKKYFVDNVGTDWVCLDGGANVGYHSILLGRLASEGKVFAFEPTSTLSMLIENLNLNGTTNVVPVGKGLSNFIGKKKDKIYRIWGRPPEESVVDFTTIDQFVEENGLERVDLIKIDVDGYDLEALEGAVDTLARFSPIVCVELNHALATRGRGVSEALAWMLDQKYDEALVLDGDNFVFSKNWQLGEPWPDYLETRFDRRNTLAALDARAVGPELTEFKPRWVLQNEAEEYDANRFVIEGSAWNYAVCADTPGIFDVDSALALVVTVHSGEIGIFLSNSKGSELLTPERLVGKINDQEVVFPLVDLKVSQIIIRKTTAVKTEFSISYSGIRGFEFFDSAPVSLGSFDREALGSVLGCPPGRGWDAVPLDFVSSVRIDELPSLFYSQAVPPKRNYLRDPIFFRMEREDAPILTWLYQEIRPERHLEFGTWEGFGTTLCLKACLADVWTVNLARGEDVRGLSAYPESREPAHPKNPGAELGRSDRGSMVGWMYRAEDFETRVHQILKDSRQLVPEDFPAEGFQTILIDGSHKRADVLADIKTAVSNASRSGVIILHDFHLDSNVVRTNEACRGVVAAVADAVNIFGGEWSLYWVEETMLLLAISRYFTGNKT